MKKLLALIAICGMLFGCSDSAIALVDSIVTSVETLIPSIPNLSPSDSAVTLLYVDAVTRISNDLISSSESPINVARAVAEFQSLVPPILSTSASPQLVLLISSTSNAVSNFINTYKGVTMTGAIAHSSLSINGQKGRKSTKISTVNKKKVDELSIRVAVLKVKIEAIKYKRQ